MLVPNTYLDPRCQIVRGWEIAADWHWPCPEMEGKRKVTAEKTWASLIDQMLRGESVEKWSQDARNNPLKIANLEELTSKLGESTETVKKSAALLICLFVDVCYCFIQTSSIINDKV